MNQIEAIKYLVNLLEKGDFKNYNEWGEAGLWHAVKRIVEKEIWSPKEVTKLYKEAENN